MNTTHKKPTWVTKSPWLDTSKTNLFRDEFQLAEEKLPDAYFTPLEPYRWIYNHNGQELFFVPVRSSKGHQTRIQVCTKLPCTSQQTIAIMNDFQPVDEKGQALGTADGMIDAVTLFGEVKMKGSALNTASNIQVALNLDRASAIATNGEVSENADRFREAQRIALLKTNGLDALASENSPGKM